MSYQQKGNVDYLIAGHDEAYLQLKFVPARRQRVTETVFALGDLSPIGVTARGSRLAPKPVSRIKMTKSAPENMDEINDENANGDAPLPAKKNKKPPPNDGGEQFSLF